ncbi:hypothetical protein [Mycolicibacterium mengxianglii]|uniref:hypothetical protein n=1 Tax=Mycolicibacterium mengxianglii TaxID=2736649 RepID=UPI0018D03FA4|nr:hypothetical protein [Mycolicibacterium mengxianglii]
MTETVTLTPALGVEGIAMSETPHDPPPALIARSRKRSNGEEFTTTYQPATNDTE